MSSITTLSQLTRQPSPFTARLLGLPVQRKAPTSLRAAENYEAVIAAHADDIARALGSTHRLPVSFHEIAVRDTATPETAAPRHRKPGPPCSDVTRSRKHRTTPFRAYLGAR